MKLEKEYDSILKKIKTLKTQGAENVAKKGIEAFLLKPTKSSANKILSLRETEPLLQNSIKVLLNSKNIKLSSEKILKEIKKSHDLIVKEGSKLIKEDMNIYSHCHSSTVIDIFKEAKKQKKNFTVYTTEVEPHLQGRKTAVNLSKVGIKVVIGPDLAAEHLLKGCDLFLFGADAYTKDFVYNKIGTKILCNIAENYNIPCYSCGIALKFTDKIKIEKRRGKEVWDERNKLIQTVYPAFDKTPNKLLTGIISEFGVNKPKDFVKLASKKIKNLN
ncbi:MAG: hypothetical protein PHX15_00335 [Candidatus Nanoarchaeia archaeon]|nr:hypothetical protein [Candidatus Nanoarchaeia archaeon]MDD3993633.1 hypothetical protein [Candidatus Nanoarchaeia archaeon]